MDDLYVPPFDVSQVARLIAEDGLSEETTKGQVRRFVQRRWLPVLRKRGAGPTAANLYGPVAVCGAKVLITLTHMGVGQDVLDLAAPRLFRWHHMQELRLGDSERYPIGVAAEAANGEPAESFRFQIELARNEYTGKQAVRVWMIDPATWLPPAWEAKDGIVPFATTTLDLLPILAPLHRRIMAALSPADKAMMASPYMSVG